VPDVLPFSSATLWRLVKAGKFPAPVRLSDRITAWRVEDVRTWMQARGGTIP
jgi:predicted DNA-binding transcriptional regulator AlpA